MVEGLYTTVSATMLGAGGDFLNAKKLIYDVGKLGAELEAVVRENDTWTTPKGNVPVDKDVGRAFSCTFSGGDGELVSTTAKAVGLCLRTSLMYDVYDCIESTDMVE